jgi:hypothetical protein
MDNPEPNQPSNSSGPFDIQVGDYTLFQSGSDGLIGIFHKNGEGGLFQTKEFEAYVAAFFGLHF